MYFTLEEIVRWLGLTVFEIWVNLISILVFTIVFALKYDPTVDVYSNNWWMIFFPLFTGDAFNAYFCVIVFIRMQLESAIKHAMLRMCWSATFLSMTFTFKLLLYKKLLGQIHLEYSEVFAPVFILLQLIAVRACQQN